MKFCPSIHPQKIMDLRILIPRFSSNTMRMAFVVSSEMFLLNTGELVMKLGTDINFSLRMDCNNFDDILTFPPPSGQNFNNSQHLELTISCEGLHL